MSEAGGKEAGNGRPAKSIGRQGLKPLIFRVLYATAEQATENALFVIPFTVNRAKRGICFSSRLPRNSRFLGPTPPFGMTRCDFFRDL